MSGLYCDADNAFCDGIDSENREMFLCSSELLQAQVECSCSTGRSKIQLPSSALFEMTFGRCG
jgi:hypothetical protein